MDERIDYWLDLAEYDMETAKAMLQTDRYLYVGFMCHQVVEKGLKAIIAGDCIDGDIPPKIHHLMKLAKNADLSNKLNEKQKDFIRELNPLNIEARYPEYKQKLSTMLTKNKCQELIKKTEEFLCWIKKQL
ncbi:MAG: HEPN domain-containing protein [Oscillospiraceae bacterium]|nr:HEPN domain-containing protein [Oscillospiraceae bacterium]